MKSKSKIRKTKSKKTRKIGGSYYSGQGSSYYTAAPGSIGSQYNLPQHQLNREKRMQRKRNGIQLRSSGMVNNNPQPLTSEQNSAWRNYNRYTRSHWTPN